jgi:hypothetical protein
VFFLILSQFRGVTIDEIWISELDLLTICTHHLELQVITALSLTSTLYKSLDTNKSFPSLLCLQQPFPSNGFLQWRFFSFLRSLSYYPANVSQVNSLSGPAGLAMLPWGGRNRKHRLQEFFYCCYERLPSDSPDIVDVFTGRYQATHVSSRDRCIATAPHATIYLTLLSQLRRL